MSANNHVVLKLIIQPLFSQLCGIDCDASKKNRIAALAAIKPLDNQQPFELSSKATQIWHPNWLGKVDDDLNMKFLKEVADCVYNNEKMQREQTQIRTIPDKSFSPEIIMECVKTYFQTIHKCAKELNSADGVLRVKHRQEYGRRRGHRIMVAAARRKAALQYEKESGHQGAAALVNMDFGSDILTCNDEEIRDPNESAEEQLRESPPPPKSTLFKTMVDHRWQSANLEVVLLDRVHWLKGFYSRMNEGDVFEADADYLKELDQWLKSSDGTPESLGEEDDV
ncbi:hypothetical protein EDC04DRAFT_2893814 [Pisolithus marmoratus]|nr:hypothetical protein EDC04DRAFT_2893814 [Pisolithus marmoratus]